MKYLVGLTIALLLLGACQASTCPKFEKNACKCNDPDPCPLIEAEGELSADKVILYKTGESSKDRLTRYEAAFEAPLSAEEAENYSGYTVTLDPSKKYQSILGFGGALTDASAVNFNKLDAATQEQVLELYYGESGLAYSLGRVPMASCDFSTSVYSYAP